MPEALTTVNYPCRRVTRLVDPDDLLDAHAVAALLGLSHARAISVYRSRYPNFPEPIINMVIQSRPSVLERG